MDDIILREIKVSKNLVEYKFKTTGVLDRFFNDNTLWISYDEDISHVPLSILSIPFISIMLPIVWVTDSVMWIPEVDRTFYNAVFSLQRAYQNLFPNHPLKGRVVPSYIVENSMGVSNDSFILFSGGLDAHTSFIRNLSSISRLVNIQGFYKHLDDDNNAADADYKDISFFAKTQMLDFSFVKSNFATLIDTYRYAPYAKKIGDTLWHGFQHSMAFISFTIPLAFKHKCSNIIIASSFTIGVKRVCASYPTTDNEFAFAGNGRVKHDAFELSRQDKVNVIVDYQRSIDKSYPIRVCSFNDKNCCECEKCFRTIIGLVAEAADISKYGFYLNKSLKEHFIDVIYRKGGLMGFSKEKLYWNDSIRRMKHNYTKMTAEQKEFVDWFVTFDFTAAQKRSRLRYYKANFFSILKRKIRLFFR